MIYKFTVYSQDNPGEVVKNTIEANNRSQAIEILRKNGFVVVNIEEESTSRFSLNNEIFTKKVSAKDVWSFTRQIETMINSGMSLLSALSETQKNTSNEKFQTIIANIISDINNGLDFSTALAKYPNIFNKLYISLIKAGEMGGILPVALTRLSKQLENDMRLKREVRSAMIYPIFSVSFAFVVIIAMLIFIVPTFQKVFESAGNELPFITQLLVSTSDIIVKVWPLLILLAVIIFFGLRKLFQSPEVKKSLFRFFLKVPKIKDILEYLNIVRFCRTLGTLLTAAIPILDAVELAIDTTNNPLSIEKTDLIKQDIQSGLSLSESLMKHNFMPSMYLAMLHSGQESAGLDSMLYILADIAEEELDNKIKNLKDISQPVIIIILGVIIGFVIIALYLPFFYVYESIQ